MGLLAQVRIVPCIAKYAGGGAHVEFVFGQGELTLARLTRSPGGYRMTIALGEAQDYPLRGITGANPGWPHAFVRLHVPPDVVVQTLQANHIHAVAGDYRAELIKLCQILNLEPVILGGN